MIKLPFRYALSSVYAKLIIDDIFLAVQSAALAGWHHALIFLDPAMQSVYQQQIQQIVPPQSQKLMEEIEQKLGIDEDAMKIVKEVCVDFQLGEIKVIMWDKKNAGYVFRRVYLPAEWKQFLTEEELKAIVGHELGHQKIGTDSLIPLRLVNRLGDEFLFSLLPVQMTGYFLVLMSFVAQNPTYLKLLSLTLLYRIFHILLENKFTRKDEYKADQFGKKVTNADSMQSALQKIDRHARLEILENLHHLPYMKQVYYHWLLKKETGTLREALLDHPFLYKRIEALKV